MNKGIFVSAAAALGLFVASAASATPTTFFGQDLDPSTSTTNSDTAHAQFLSNLSGGVGTEDFEATDFSVGDTAPFTLTFPGSTGAITATLTGTDAEIEDSLADGRFPTSGTQYLETSQNFVITFSDPIAAFGFYGTDIGDFGGQLTLTLTGGATVTLTIPAVIGSGGSTSGNQLFFGFIDSSQTYTQIAFGQTATGDDFFGFDDMTIGDLQQVVATPEPGSLAMLGSGLLGLISLLLLRRRAA